MEFEFDRAKSAANKQKHGIDFVEAESLWLDPKGVVIGQVGRGERREMRVAVLGGKFWTSVYTLRRGKTRLISVRRARHREVEDYEQRQP